MQIEVYGPNCTAVLHDLKVYYFSYTTLVGYKDIKSGVECRIRSCSNTTSKHMSKMGIKNFPEVSNMQLNELAGD